MSRRSPTNATLERSAITKGLEDVLSRLKSFGKQTQVKPGGSLELRRLQYDIESGAIQTLLGELGATLAKVHSNVSRAADKCATEMLKDVLEGRLDGDSGFAGQMGTVFEDAEKYKKAILDYAAKPFDRNPDSYPEFPKLSDPKYDLRFLQAYFEFAEDVKYAAIAQSEFRYAPRQGNVVPNQLHLDIVIRVSEDSLREGSLGHLALWLPSYLRASSGERFPARLKETLTPYAYQSVKRALDAFFAKGPVWPEYGYEELAKTAKRQPELAKLLASYPGVATRGTMKGRFDTLGSHVSSVLDGEPVTDGDLKHMEDLKRKGGPFAVVSQMDRRRVANGIQEMRAKENDMDIDDADREWYARRLLVFQQIQTILKEGNAMPSTTGGRKPAKKTTAKDAKRRTTKKTI